MKLAEKLVKLALAEVGVEEIDGTNCGPRVNEYKAATNLPPKESWPWCAAFLCWLIRAAMDGGSYTFARPVTASAWGFEAWSRAQDDSTHTLKPAGGRYSTRRYCHLHIFAHRSRDFRARCQRARGDGRGQHGHSGIKRGRRRFPQDAATFANPLSHSLHGVDFHHPPTNPALKSRVFSCGDLRAKEAA